MRVIKPTTPFRAAKIGWVPDWGTGSILRGNGRRSFLAGVIWGLLSLWLFFGSVAFVEQINSLLDTSDQDEQALSLLVVSLKPDVPTLQNQLTSSGTATVMVAPSRILATGLSQSVSIPAQNLALRPHQRVSVYRI